MSGNVSLAVNEKNVAETAGSVSVSFVRSGDLSKAVTVLYQIQQDGATAGADYVGRDGSVTIAAGAREATISIPVLNDALAEATEDFVVAILDVDSGVLTAPRTTRVNILDDESPVVIPAEPPLESRYDVTEVPLFSRANVLDIDFLPGRDNLMLVLERTGVIRIFDTAAGRMLDEPFYRFGPEAAGVLSMEIHPDFPEQPYVYAYYRVDPPDTAGETGNAGPGGGGARFMWLVRMEADPDADFLKIIPGSETILVGGAGQSLDDISGRGALDFDQGPIYADRPGSDQINLSPAEIAAGLEYRQDFIKGDANHFGGGMTFGPDGMLYIALGDSGAFNFADPRVRSVQSLDALNGKVLRIDPITGQGLADNPFVRPGDDLDLNRSKVFQLGLRNPFSIMFDEDGGLVITDTGQFSWEELNSAAPGANFGWPWFEGADGDVLFANPNYRNAFPDELAAFIASGVAITPAWRAFSHRAADPGFQFQAVTGGKVEYSGDRYPDSLDGAYFFSDYSDGEIFIADLDDRNSVEFLYKRDGMAPIQFIQGPDGYVYYVALESREVGRLEIVERGGPAANRVDLTAAKATYPGTAGRDLYVVDAASDSTAAGRDRIMGFSVAAGDRIDFSALGWDADDIVFTRHSVGTAGEFTRVNGPGGFSLRVDGTQAALAGGFIFGAEPSNRPPVAANDAATSVAGAQVTIDVLGNDSDPDGDGLDVSGFDAVSANGGVIVRAGAGLAYRPAAGFFGTDTFEYVASDGEATDAATVTVTVTRPASGGRIVNLTAAKTVYNGRAGADIYVVDQSGDSTAAARDVIHSFDPAAGDRIDLGPAGWDSGDITLRGFEVGRPGEFTRIEGPGGFSLRVDGPSATLAGAILFADDTLI